MRVLGVDPGTRHTGVGVVESKGNQYRLIAFECISPSEKWSVPNKLKFIYEQLLTLITCHQPDIVALENVFYQKNIRSMLRIGEARACVMLAASKQGVDVVEYPPARVKQSVSGNGRATKEQIQAMVKTLLGLKETPPPDASDALAIAICHHHQFRGLAGKSPARLTKKSLLAMAQMADKK